MQEKEKKTIQLFCLGFILLELLSSTTVDVTKLQTAVPDKTYQLIDWPTSQKSPTKKCNGGAQVGRIPSPPKISQQTSRS